MLREFWALSMDNFQKVCKGLMPPIIYEYLKKLFKKRSIRGSFKNWTDAKNNSDGYDSIKILEKVLEATLCAIKEGGYERDGIHFIDQQYSWPIVCGVLLGAIRSPKCIQVLDFGGALGGLYLQHKKILDLVSNLRWGIIEQKCFVDAGKKHINVKNLDFYYSFYNYLKNVNPDVVIFSSSLQYLENIEEILDEVIKSDANFLVIDRTPFHQASDHHIKIQFVPKNIYNASYPIRIFSKQALLSRLGASWELIASGASPEGVMLADDGSEISFEWLIMERVGV